MTALQEATAMNAQYNLIYRADRAELMFQHVQFRRIEKFMKNYLDAGKVTQELV
jgi:hypothetical protein